MAASPENHHAEHEPSPQIPPAVDSDRSPQLNKVVCRCRSGCACASSRGDGVSDSDGGGFATSQDMRLPIAAIDDDAGSVHGDEGVADHSIKVGVHGMIKIKTIHVALARHEQCTCHPRGHTSPATFIDGVDTTEEDYLVASSAYASLGGEKRYLSPRAGYSRSPASPSATSGNLVVGAGGMFEQDESIDPSASLFLGQPLWLGHGRGGDASLDFGDVQRLGFRYPQSLSMGSVISSDHSEYDMW